jgi:hypothetical protein
MAPTATIKLEIARFILICPPIAASTMGSTAISSVQVSQFGPGAVRHGASHARTSRERLMGRTHIDVKAPRRPRRRKCRSLCSKRGADLQACPPYASSGARGCHLGQWSNGRRQVLRSGYSCESLVVISTARGSPRGPGICLRRSDSRVNSRCETCTIH